MAQRRALVIGGSMSGLLAALMLRRRGWEADIYERVAGELAGLWRRHFGAADADRNIPIRSALLPASLACPSRAGRCSTAKGARR